MLSPTVPANKKVLLLDRIPKTAIIAFTAQNYIIEECYEKLSEAQLVRKLSDVQIVCLSDDDPDYLTDEVLGSAHRLLAIAVFSQNASQVNLSTATSMGIPVFTAPYQHRHSVAELIISFVILLARKVGDRSNEIHSGIWNKKADGAHEVRGKTLGLVGYGQVGSQVGIMAEALSLRVIFYDNVPLMPIGSAESKETLAEIMQEADFVCVNVSCVTENIKLIGKEEIGMMKRGAYLINATYSEAVDLDAVAEALRAGHLGGAAFDALPFPKDASSYEHPFKDLSNVILTPRIGSETEDAQNRIGVEVSNSVIAYINQGATNGAINFPNIHGWPLKAGTRRIINIHRNVRGVLREIDYILSAYNVGKQILDTKENVGYLVADIATENVTTEIVAQMSMLANTIRTRIL